MALIERSPAPTTTTNPGQRLRAAVIGYGYWGPNLARNIAAHAGTELVAIGDLSMERLGHAHNAHPWAQLTADTRALLAQPDIGAVVIATPPETHRDLTIEALERGKHVLVEKPLATCTADAQAMADAARACNRTLMVDHTFLFTGAVRRMKEYVDARTLGEIYYFDSTRINLGLFQTHANVIWDLAPHDISIMAHLLKKPVRSGRGVGVRAPATEHPGPELHPVSTATRGSGRLSGQPRPPRTPSPRHSATPQRRPPLGAPPAAAPPSPHAHPAEPPHPGLSVAQNLATLP